MCVYIYFTNLIIQLIPYLCKYIDHTIKLQNYMSEDV